MRLLKDKNFCDLGPICYWISEEKEILKRHIQNFFKKEPFSRDILSESLPNVVARYSNAIIKTGKGIDPVLQQNKAVNLRIVCDKISGMVIHPGEVFSFWAAVGKITRKKGYKDGRVLMHNRLVAGLGGGLCNLANTINWLVLHSPLEVTEFHNHSDALAPVHGKRVPFSSGTSVSYNYIDYRFRNNTNQDVQLLLWCENGALIGELRSQQEFPFQYELTEKDCHYKKEGQHYYHVSMIYQDQIDRNTGKILSSRLVWNNHSQVMFDESQIPKDEIRT